MDTYDPLAPPPSDRERKKKEEKKQRVTFLRVNFDCGVALRTQFALLSLPYTVDKVGVVFGLWGEGYTSSGLMISSRSLRW